MPIHHHIHRELRLAVSIHLGIVRDQEFLDSYRSFFDNPAHDLSFSHLVDLRRTDSSQRSGEALRSVAAFMQRRYQGAGVAPKTAVVAPRDVSFGVARMFQAFSDLVPGEVIVFRAVEPALAWLGVPDEALPELRSPEGPEEE